jgi:hypothetical protein
MTERQQATYPESPGQRLADEAARLRKQARGTPPGIERDRLIRRARQAETGSQMRQWPGSNGLRSPQ